LGGGACAHNRVAAQRQSSRTRTAKGFSLRCWYRHHVSFRTPDKFNSIKAKGQEALAGNVHPQQWTRSEMESYAASTSCLPRRLWRVHCGEVMVHSTRASPWLQTAVHHIAHALSCQLQCILLVPAPLLLALCCLQPRLVCNHGTGRTGYARQEHDTSHYYRLLLH
jgi:hypothetical protein